MIRLLIHRAMVCIAALFIFSVICSAQKADKYPDLTPELALKFDKQHKTYQAGAITALVGVGTTAASYGLIKWVDHQAGSVNTQMWGTTAGMLIVYGYVGMGCGLLMTATGGGLLLYGSTGMKNTLKKGEQMSGLALT
ncbi:MAG: hypothetical protein MJZ09_00900 [Bacteroidales bacterium]|nr:hypothetical protein [Bacteroidales bacterium]